MSKNIYIVVFYILIVLFSVCYWSFFPGAYTYDTYISYLNSLGLFKYLEVVPPIYALNWKIVNNYNFAPLLVNYLIFIIALILSIKFTKNYRVAILSLIGICLPYTLITYICAWKDNALLSVLFLITVLCLNKNKSTFNNVIALILFFVASSLRLNAFFAVIPLLYYFLHNSNTRLKSIVLTTDKKAYTFNNHNRYNRLKSLGLTILLVLAFQFVNKGLNKYVFRAEVGHLEQSIMFTDIAKINYLQHKNPADDIPEVFVIASNLDSENVDKLFGVYFNDSCNDWLYMYPETKGAKAFLHLSDNIDDINKLKINWVKKIIYNPISYLRVRSAQLNSALWMDNLLYSPPMLNFNEEVFNRIAGGSEVTKNFDRENKVFLPMTNDFAVTIRSLIDQRSKFLDIVSSAGLYFILSIIMFIIFLLNRMKNNYFRLGMYLSLSGVFYIIGYLPWLPCTDHRYFIWTIFAFWVSVGILALAMIKTEITQPSEVDEPKSLDHF
jgi:hypothetical protein